MMGRPRNFESPEELLQAFEEYKEDLKIQAHEWVKVQYVGKDGERVEDKFKLPMTYEGFKIFCRKNEKYGDVKAYFENTNNAYTNFSDICLHIKEEIRNNQITGGLLGVFNTSITQRLNGLTEKQDVTNTIKLGKELEDEYE